jgi:Phage tail lysozyme
MSYILREYLLSLGFKIDDASYKKFNAALATTAKEAAGLGSVVTGAATAIGLSVEKVSEQYQSLVFLGQRTGNTVNNLKAYSYAAKQIGIDFGQSQGAIESFAAAMRLNPGVKGFVQANGGTGKDSIEQLTNFVAQQKKLYGEAGYYVAAMNAEVAGIPEGVFLQIWNNLPRMKAAQADMKKLREEAGLAGDDIGKKGDQFATAWGHLLEVLDVGKDRIAFDLMKPTQDAVIALDDLIQRFNKADVASDGFLGKVVGFTTALGGTAAALALVLRMVGLGGMAGAAAKGGGRLLLGAATNPVVAGAIAAYYGIGLDGATAGKEDDSPLSKEYRAKHGGAGGSQAQLRDATIAYFQSQGWSRAAATGIAANISAESKFDATAVGDNGSAYGIAQWHPDRQRAFAQWAGKDIRQSSLQDQLGFVQYELTQGADVGARRAGADLKNAGSAFAAGSSFSMNYERPGNWRGEATDRGLQAQNWFDVPLTSGAAGTTATITQKTDIHVAASDPKAAGEAVASAQGRVNGDLVRNMQGMAR